MHTSWIRYAVFIALSLSLIVYVPQLLATSNADRVDALTHELETEVESLFITILSQFEEATQTMVRDYSIWDEMIELAEGRKDIDWARDNIGVSLDTYQTTGAWLFTAAGELRYSILRRNGADSEMEPFFLPASTVLELAADHQQHSFFIAGPGGIYFTSIGGVVSVSDPDRTGPVHGYLIASTLVDETVIVDMEQATNTSITLTTDIGENTSPVLDRSTGLYSFTHQLTDVHGTTVGTFVISRTLSSLSLHAQAVARERTVARIALIVALIGIGLSLFMLDRSRQRAVRIAATMTTELRTANANLEERVALRTKELADDIERRERFENDLKTRTHELELMNKAMLDREARIIELKQKAKGEATE